MAKFIDKILSKCHCGLRKGHSAAYIILAKEEKKREDFLLKKEQVLCD